jgi:hypothetical protein
VSKANREAAKVVLPVVIVVLCPPQDQTEDFLHGLVIVVAILRFEHFKQVNHRHIILAHNALLLSA